jgi:transposase-like protein
LYFRYPLSFREVEELKLERGVTVSYETGRRWCGKFGQAYAGALRRRQPRPGDKWHLDEVFIKINGVQRYLWRAVDQDGNVLDILVQNRRDKAAARRFFRRTGHSLIRTAEEQHVHRNTIVYRMRRIEELLPAPLSEQRLQIHLALRLAVQYGARTWHRPQAD